MLSAFQRYLGWRLGSKIDPKPANLPHVTLPSPPPSVLLTPHWKITAPSAGPTRPRNWNNTINFFIFMVLALCSYPFSTGRGRLMALCPDDMTPCLMAILSTWRRLHHGVFTSSKHLLAQQREKSRPNEKRLICHSGGCGTGTILADAFPTAARMMKSVQCTALTALPSLVARNIMHQLINRASWLLKNFSNFSLLTMLDS